MQGVMANEKIRLVIQADEEIRAALRLESGKTGEDMSVLAEKILREGLAEAIEEIREIRKQQKKGKP